MKKAVFFFLLLIFSGDMIALALEPPAPEEIEAYRRDGSLKERIANARALGNHLVAPHLMERLRYKLRRMVLELQGFRAEEIEGILAPPPAWRGMPTKGTVKVLALLIEFSDYPHQSQNSKEAIESKLFGDGSGGAPYESLRNYYRRSSYDQLEIQGTVLGWYNTGLSRSSVLETTAGREDLIKTALNYYNGLGHDFTQYDSDDDGTIDYLIVIWTGPDNGWANFWWGYMTSFTDSSYQIDGKRLETYSWQWEAYPYPGTFSPRVVIHETGHALGLPDYYDYDGSVGPKGGIGGLDMMDANFGDHNCFSKFLLEWINPAAYSGGNQMLTLYASGSTKDQSAIVVMPGAVQGDPFGEFFMVQNRHRLGNDTGYPSDGLLIWHVDSTLNHFGTDFVYDNSYTSHKLLRLMEADGLEEIEKDLDTDGDDYYVSGRTFGTATTPNSNRYDGTETGVVVFDIGPSGNPMSFKLSLDCPVPVAPGSPSPGDGEALVLLNPTLGWSASDASSFDVYFGTTTNPPFLGTTVESQYSLSGLIPDTLYRWQIRARNACGNVSVSPVWSFRTKVNPPGTASFSNVTPSCIRANWTANGNPSGTEYLCRNETLGTDSGWTSDTSWNNCGLSCNEAYSYSVKARDGAGNETSWVSLGSGTTAVCSMAFPFFDDFSTDMGWVGYEVGGWERKPAAAGGGEYGYPDPGTDRSLSSDNYLLGFNVGGDYPNNLTEKGIVSPPISTVGQNQVCLRYWRYLNVESNLYDHARIYLSTDGTSWTMVWENPILQITDHAWILVAHDISSLAANQESLYVKFTMGPTDYDNRFSGWNLDDFGIVSSCDLIPPEGTIVINGGATYTNTTSVNLTLSASDLGGSGLFGMQFSNDASTWSSWEAYGSTKAWVLDSGDGTKTVFVRFKDNAGNVSASFSDTIVLDTSGPSGSVLINGGAEATNDTHVSLTLSAYDGLGVSEMRFSNDGAPWSSWEPFGASKEWILPPGDGTKTVFVQFKDGLGNTSDPSSDTIYLDTVPPEGAVLIAGGEEYTNTTSVDLTLGATDPGGSGLSRMRFSNDQIIWSSWQAYGTSTSWTLSSGDGLKTVFVQFEDKAGNVSSSYSDDIVLDSGGPVSGTISINNGELSTTSSVVTLTDLGAVDPSSVTHMSFSNSVSGPWSSPEPYATIRSGWDITSSTYGGSSAPGTKRVYVKYSDEAGNWSVPFSDEICYQPVQPFPFSDDFSTDKGWCGFGGGRWQRGLAASGGGENGNPDPEDDWTGEGFILGYALGGDYPNDLDEEDSITSPPIDCSGEEQVFLRFRRYLNVEGNDSDHARIYLSSDGIDWKLMWENPEAELADDRWTQVVYDISSRAAHQRTVYIRFSMGPTNEAGRYSGWNIDEIEVISRAAAPAEGTIGTTIKIVGSGFGTKKGKVLIGTTALKILSWTDSLIESLVSKGIPSGIYDLVVLPKRLPEIRMEEYFSVRLPEIDSVEPDRGSVGEPISIQGRFFGTKKGKVYLDCGTGAMTVRKSGKVMSWSMNATTGEGEIQFLVPKGLPIGSCDLTLTNTVGSSIWVGGFVVE